MKQIYLEFKQVMRSTGPIVLLFTLSMISRAVGFLPYIPELVGYGIMMLMAVYIFSKFKHVDGLMTGMIVYLALNILICKPDPVFNSWMRLGFFGLLLVCVSPLVQGEQLREVRHKTLNATLWILAMLTVASFFCRFLGINYMWGGQPGSYNTAGLFGGLFNQSMMLGPLAGASAVFMAYKAFEANKKERKLYIYATLMCLAAVFFSASRSALMCSMAGVLVTLMKASGGSQRFLKIMTVAMLVGAVTFPLWGGVTDAMMEKANANIEAGGFTTSRDEKWNARITEFESSPVFGIGYPSVNPNLDDVGFGGVVEPGTSWLAILSMTGIVGFVLFFSIFYKAYKACNRMCRREDALYLGLLALFAVHMMAEGYVFAAGGFLCFILWLVIGCCYDRSYESN